MNKTGVKAVLALLVFGMAFGGYVMAHEAGSEISAMSQRYGKRMMDPESAEQTGEHHELVMQAIEAGDYGAWKALTEDCDEGGRMTDVVTEENFDLFCEMRLAMKEGDFETARAIKEELGLERLGKGKDGHGGSPKRGIFGRGHGRGPMFGNSPTGISEE